MRIEGEDKYFTAKDAKAVADEVNRRMKNEELDSIYKKINDARFEGHTSVTFKDTKFRKETVDFLQSKGFVVKHFTGCQWDPANDTTIYWS